MDKQLIAQRKMPLCSDIEKFLNKTIENFRIFVMMRIIILYITKNIYSVVAKWTEWLG
ncbi:hypothetical protein N784_02785 [Pontibacillus litoralis JSM 072002]|uniref:Uncharacterized protein n=1 Tax=Pontibacillus litoralis JSM 072002 TaxID=1385512 RepID=A0A0A5G4X5_9BACI|nr:hypothetical protein N784_02785 [Pontibacillus litoralis JSM 072002]